MNLIIKNKVISEPIINIIKQLKKEATWNVFSDIQIKNDYIRVTCPYHKDGNEHRASCSIYSNYDGDIEPGYLHCFTCGASGPLYKTVAHVLELSDEDAKDWLIERFGNTLIEKEIPFDSPITFEKQKQEYLNEECLDKYGYYHPYMFQRHLTEEVINKFKIGYDKEKDCIVFPVWDEKGNLVTITRRSVIGKRFILEGEKDKPVYLLNFIRKENRDVVYVCESQFNALTLWTWGYPAVALFGTGSYKQYEVLNKSGIRSYILCFDGDDAGRKGAERFKRNVKGFFQTKVLPEGKDVNDLTKEEFDNLKIF